MFLEDTVLWMGKRIEEDKMIEEDTALWEDTVLWMGKRIEKEGIDL